MTTTAQEASIMGIFDIERSARTLETSSAEYYNGLCEADPDRAERLDGVLRMIIREAPGKQIVAIKAYRDMALAFGVQIGLKEAKDTLDALRRRVAIEIMREMLRTRVGSARHDDLGARLDAIDPTIRGEGPTRVL